ncbi:MAG: FG-GAP-like repeat-containing protein [Bacteroidia bacterium]|nr:FG-GAP-like repeat-containing protein [Bacteroidia bacterium]
MKKLSGWALALSLTVAYSSVAQAQHFTKINSAPFSTDFGDTRGVAWGDADGDGDADLYMTNLANQTNFFYENVNGVFVKKTNTAISTFVADNGAAFWADFDNDGDQDLFTYHNDAGTHSLFVNNGNLSFSLPPSTVSSSSGPGRVGAWADYDNDGYLDLFIARESNFDNLLFHNNGNGTFTQITTGIIVNDGGKSRGAGWCDYDLDGDMDLFVPNYLQSDFFYRNDGGGNFTKITTGAFVNTSSSSFGASWGDLNNDGYPDLYVANFKNPNALYINNGNGTFATISNANVNLLSTNANSSSLADIDNDGDLDILVISGEVNCPTGDCTNDLFLNTGNNLTFVLPPANEPFTIDDDPSQGVALADYDADGYLDVAVSNRDNFKNYLFHNNGGSNHWMQIKLQGIASNAQGIGARLKILTGSTWQTRQVLANSGYRSQNDLTAHFGVGGSSVIDSLIIYWPSGEVCSFDRLPVDSIYTFIEGCSACEALGKVGVSSQNVSCPGDSDGSLEVIGYPNTSNFMFSLNPGTFQNSPSFAPLPAGIYQVEVIDDKGCKYFYSATVAEPDSLLANLQSTSTTNANGNNGSAWASPTGGTWPFTYAWSTGGVKDTISNLSFGMYFLTITDGNGCVTTDSVFVGRGVVESLADFPSSHSWSIFPNPSGGQLTLEWDFPTQETLTVSLMDMAGKQLALYQYLHQTSGQDIYDLNLPPGIYLLIISTEKYSAYRRIVIQP